MLRSLLVTRPVVTRAVQSAVFTRLGSTISIRNGKLTVPNDPIIPFIEGDGTGPDIWRASVRVFDAAVKKAYNGKKKIEWLEVWIASTHDAHRSSDDGGALSMASFSHRVAIVNNERIGRILACAWNTCRFLQERRLSRPRATGCQRPHSMRIAITWLESKVLSPLRSVVAFGR
jgi:hypothetical protein